MTREKKRSFAPAPKYAPYSIHSALTHAQNLTYNNQFDTAIQECELALPIENPIKCESALSVENPIDPIKDDDIKRGFEKVKTPSPANFDPITRAKAYWNNVMSLKAKKELMSVRIKDLKVYVDENKSMGQRAKAELLKIVDCAVMSNDFDWKILMCCCCENMFLDARRYTYHMMTEHCSSFQNELNYVVPIPVPKLKIEISDWRLVDVIAAAKLVEDWSRNESGDQDESKDLKLKPWPYCDDINRENLIKKIQLILEVLIQTECFAPSHLYMLLGLILDMRKNRIPEMLLKHHLMNRTLVTVLFLDESEPERVLAFLRDELETSCGLHSLHISIMRDRLRGDPKNIRKEIVLSDDLSRLIPLFDESKSSSQKNRDNIV
ncbi:hypothetical protein SO802_005315 [Lithocarpus litseifolius]|uniref:DUF629 domain-containing protein n=1 Tax=Lithocarpus litseifolius TaxID=425828 RepID=A0AAW2DHU7_9ROSI